mmetsp:Transcript_13097/g.18545  ORF Transcript_13097/g.18545 Transcript_13097/m.18545 type:complete len:184 (+) Transcript_13097:117-668(+)
MSHIHNGAVIQQQQQQLQHRHYDQRQGFTQSEIQELKDCFQLFDTEGRGKIKCSELHETISKSGNENQQQILKLLQQLKRKNHNDDELDFEQFLTVMTCSIGNSDGDETNNNQSNEIRRIFDLFDHDKTGYITMEDLQLVASNLGETMSYEELQEMIDRANPKLPGKVSPDEFYQIMTKKLFP